MWECGSVSDSYGRSVVMMGAYHTFSVVGYWLTSRSLSVSVFGNGRKSGSLAELRIFWLAWSLRYQSEYSVDSWGVIHDMIRDTLIN